MREVKRRLWRSSKRPTDRSRTYGYHRFEILAAAFNAMLLFGVAIYILYEAYRRLSNPPEIQSTGMLVIAVLGLAINLISMRVLAGDRDKNLNMKGAYLEVWSDMLGSLGVIIGAIVIKFTAWTWVDSAIAVAIGLWVLPRTWILLKSSVNILLEGVPEDLDLAEVEASLLAVPGVTSFHDLHVWALTSGKVSLTVHVVLQAGSDPDVVLDAIRYRMHKAFEISHLTVQCERKPCGQGATADHFLAADSHDHAHATP